MKYKDFKKLLDEHFNDEDEIFPHAGFSCVSFYHVYHGQNIGMIFDDDRMTAIDFTEKLNDNKSNTGWERKR